MKACRFKHYCDVSLSQSSPCGFPRLGKMCQYWKWFLLWTTNTETTHRKLPRLGLAWLLTLKKIILAKNFLQEFVNLNPGCTYLSFLHHGMFRQQFGILHPQESLPRHFVLLLPVKSFLQICRVPLEFLFQQSVQSVQSLQQELQQS